jgi:hypothetical protein
MAVLPVREKRVEKSLMSDVVVVRAGGVIRGRLMSRSWWDISSLLG